MCIWNKIGRLDINEEGIKEDGVRESPAIDLRLELNVERIEDHAKQREKVWGGDIKNKKIEVEARLEGSEWDGQILVIDDMEKDGLSCPTFLNNV